MVSVLESFGRLGMSLDQSRSRMWMNRVSLNEFESNVRVLSSGIDLLVVSVS